LLVVIVYLYLQIPVLQISIKIIKRKNNEI
jgi:hypothetical protein